MSALEELSKYYDEVSRCSRCGFCQPTCPTYKLEDGESDVARGRNALVRAVIEGRASLNQDSIQMIDECLRCGACVTACFAGVRTDRIMAAARTHYVETKGRGVLLGIFMERIFHRRRLLLFLMRLASRAKNLGWSRWTRYLAWMGSWPQGLARADQLVPKLPARLFSDDFKAGQILAPFGARRAKVVYFIGCRTEFLYPHLGADSVDLLRRFGAEVHLLQDPATCCGLPPYSYGYAKAARTLVRQNVLAFDAVECDFIVTEIGSCYHFLKEYAELYGQDHEFGEAARRVAAKIMYVADYLIHMGFDQAGTVPGYYPKKVTFQDSCQLLHLQKTKAAPRSLLKSLGQIDFREMEEASWCCGGAGAYTITHPEQAEPMLKRKLKAVEATGAQEIVVSCQSCYMQISHGLRDSGSKVVVKHLVEVLKEAMDAGANHVL